jgi:predicted HTH domain antitoxin
MTDPREEAPSPTEARRAAVVAAYRAGHSLRRIAALAGRTPQAIHGILRRAGEPMRPRGGNQGSHSRHAK